MSEIITKGTIDKSLNYLGYLHADVGSIIMTGTSTKPNETQYFKDIGLQDTQWDCIKKDFKEQAIYDTNAITWNNSYTCNGSTDGERGCVVYLCGNSVYIRTKWSNKVAMDDTTREVGRLKMDNIGITSFPYMIYNCGFNDGNGAVIFSMINGSGVISMVLWVSNSITKVYPTTKGVYIGYQTFQFPDLPPGRMKDDFCQAWYWKRTA